MAKESFAIQIMVEDEFESLRLENKILVASIEHTKETHDAIKELITELDWDTIKYSMLNKEINSLVALS